ncbi:MAG: DUF4062 domain-containing protein, partial [Phycisphaerales bacterium]
MEIPINLPQRKPTVFISSQMSHFKNQRALLADMIERELNLSAYRFEDLSRPHPPRRVYKACIEQSQFFVGVYGSAYGWIDAKGGMEISGIHDEWRIATERGMHRLVFVGTEEPKDARLQKLIEDEISPEVSYTSFESVDELIESVKKSLEQLLHECIFAGLHGTGTHMPDYAKTLVERYEGHTILRTSFFTDGLCPLLDQNRRVFVYGAPGSGKTVSLMLLARRENCVYVSLKNKSSLGVIDYLANR